MKTVLVEYLESGTFIGGEEDSFTARIEPGEVCVVLKKKDFDALTGARKCTCDDSTGWTAIRCCNLCGLIHKSETLNWRINLE